MTSSKKWSETIVIFHPIYSVSDMYNLFYIYENLFWSIENPSCRLTATEDSSSKALNPIDVNPRVRILDVSLCQSKVTYSSYPCVVCIQAQYQMHFQLLQLVDKENVFRLISTAHNIQNLTK